MGAPYSKDLRERVLAYIERGGAKTAAHELFQVGEDTIYRWIRRKKQTGTPEAKKPERKPYKIQQEALLSELEKRSDATLKELATALLVSDAGVLYACRRLKLTRKKNAPLRRARRSETTTISAGA